MTDLLCLSDRAIRMIKEHHIKFRIMSALEIFDTRTIDKHIKNNFPNSPLMNFNVREIMRKESPEVNEKDLYRKLTKIDVERIDRKRNEMKLLNAKYNNLKKKVQ